MSVLQVWLVIALPALVVAAALFYGRSRLRSALGYVLLLVAFGAVLTVDPGSAAVLGGFIALLYAAGRGGQTDAEELNTSTIGVPDETRYPVRRDTSSTS